MSKESSRIAEEAEVSPLHLELRHEAKRCRGEGLDALDHVVVRRHVRRAAGVVRVRRDSGSHGLGCPGVSKDDKACLAECAWRDDSAVKASARKKRPAPPA